MTTKPVGVAVSHADLFPLLADLVRTLLHGSYEGTYTCETLVREVAATYGHTVDVTFLADSAILTLGERTASFSATPDVPPLDRISRLKRVLIGIHDGSLTPGEARARIVADAERPPRWRRPWQVFGLVLFSVGFGISIQPSWQQVIVCTVTGLLVGLLVAAGRGKLWLTLASPLIGSIMVSSVVLFAYRQDWVEGAPIPLILPALFYFIPGDALSAACLELVVGRMTAGTARLVYAMVTLLVLAFGASLATFVADVPADALFDSDGGGDLGPWAVWIGWSLFTVGIMFGFSMTPRDLPWALLVVLVTVAAVQIGTRAVGDPTGTFIGAVVMTVTALTLGRFHRLPPAYVLHLGAFYVLTPGAHGLRGLETWLGGDQVEGLTDIASMAQLLMAIGLGMLVGAIVAGPKALRHSL
ncbi:threonine/serine exporter family protein [Phytomonospora sp. NPDC050363]|uniref:threonine/serine ThrE exporter family protein n=1 Tax=Phytomonospora sp. NPDC050363 TaxID=3155642 RepID=UPI0034004E07